MTSQDISDYDKHNYDYSTYWKSRAYENEAEKLAFTKLTEDFSGNWFIDLGGSYGRNFPLYKDKYVNKVIVDYSIKALKQAKAMIKDKNLFLVAANAYELPFKEGSFDGGCMIRVIHHLEDAPSAIDNVSRVTRKSGNFLLEFANKIHIKARLRALLKLNLDFFNTNPHKQETKGNMEGTDSKTEGIILNFHPRWIKRKIGQKGFKIESKQGVSFLRIPLLKRLLGNTLMLSLEKTAQVIFGKTNISPSIFLKLRKTSGKTLTTDSIEDILCCPRCKSVLKIKRNKISCSKCESKFSIKSGIYDLRYPEPQ